MKVKLNKLDVGIIVNSLSQTKTELTEYTVEEVNIVLLKWLITHEEMNDKEEKVVIDELEFPLVLKSLNLFRNKQIKDVYKREILDELILKITK